MALMEKPWKNLAFLKKAGSFLFVLAALLLAVGNLFAAPKLRARAQVASTLVAPVEGVPNRSGAFAVSGTSVRLYEGALHAVLVGVDKESAEWIEGTPEHPFWLPKERVWRPLAELKKGDRLSGLGGELQVFGHQVRFAKVLVFNLRVPGAHAFRVGRFGGLVHNQCGAGKGGYNSFPSLKRALGPAGKGRQWHHIVEQSKVGQFGANAIHSADNVVAIPTDVHRKISGFYSSKQSFTEGQIVRQWLEGQSFEQQRAFGQQVLRDFGVGK
jgi:hypothetical protein